MKGAAVPKLLAPALRPIATMCPIATMPLVCWWIINRSHWFPWLNDCSEHNLIYETAKKINK